MCGAVDAFERAASAPWKSFASLNENVSMNRRTMRTSVHERLSVRYPRSIIRLVVARGSAPYLGCLSIIICELMLEEDEHFLQL